MKKRGRPVKVEHTFGVPDAMGFGFLAAFFPMSLVNEVLLETGRLEQRSRSLPSRLVVYDVLAMALYADEGYRASFRLLAQGLRSLDPAVPGVVPQTSAFSRARGRVGTTPIPCRRSACSK